MFERDPLGLETKLMKKTEPVIELTGVGITDVVDRTTMMIKVRRKSRWAEALASKRLRQT